MKHSIKERAKRVPKHIKRKVDFQFFINRNKQTIKWAIFCIALCVALYLTK